MVNDHTKGVPCGAARKKLVDDKHLVKVALRRNMSASQARTAIFEDVSSIESLNITRMFTFLECDSHRLVVASDQQPDNDAIIESAFKRKGAVLYVCAEIKDRKSDQVSTAALYNVTIL